MNQLIAFCIALFLFVTPAVSQSSVWKVEGNGTVLYLGGSIHLLRQQDYPLPPAFDYAYEQCDILVLETNINPADMVNVRSKILGLALYPNNKSLKTELSKGVYNKLDSAFQKSGIELTQLNSMKPVMAILTLTGIEWQKMGLKTDGVDMHYLKKAQMEQKEILFLEEIDEQIRLITDMGEGTENEFVLMSLKDLKESRERMEELIETWKKGDYKNTIEQLDEFKKSYPDVYHSLVTERNNNWMLHMPDYLNTPEIEFVVVGAMHLYGPEGMLTQLKQKGYRTEQLK